MERWKTKMNEQTLSHCRVMIIRIRQATLTSSGQKEIVIKMQIRSMRRLKTPIYVHGSRTVIWYLLQGTSAGSKWKCGCGSKNWMIRHTELDTIQLIRQIWIHNTCYKFLCGLRKHHRLSLTGSWWEGESCRGIRLIMGNIIHWIFLFINLSDFTNKWYFKLIRIGMNCYLIWIND